jgi:hypothetical protein
VLGIGPQIGFLFPVETPAGIMQGYLNIKGYAEFDRQNRPAGFDTWLTFSISPAPQTARLRAAHAGAQVVGRRSPPSMSALGLGCVKTVT